jgi:hypothetical protein
MRYSLVFFVMISTLLPRFASAQVNRTRHAITDDYSGACSIHAQNVDGDGDNDVLASAWHGSELAWWEYGGGSPIQWTKHSICAGPYNAYEITAADMDGDNNIDVLGAAARTDGIFWFENDSLNPCGWTQHTISDSFDGARSAKATGNLHPMRWFQVSILSKGEGSYVKR